LIRGLENEDSSRYLLVKVGELEKKDRQGSEVDNLRGEWTSEYIAYDSFNDRRVIR